jgi:hypothetical protein
VEALQLSLAEAQARADKLEEALERIRDYHGNWALNMRQIALEALK